MKEYKRWDKATNVLPQYLRFWIFIKRGFYNGAGWEVKKSRILCYFDRHHWVRYLSCVEVKPGKVQFEKQQPVTDGYHVSFSLSCSDCGGSKKFTGQYSRYAEHRITDNETKLDYAKSEARNPRRLSHVP